MALSKPMEMLAAAIAAGCGGFLSTSILYPLDTIKTRMQSDTPLLPKDDDKTTTFNKHLTLVKSLYQGAAKEWQTPKHDHKSGHWLPQRAVPSANHNANAATIQYTIFERLKSIYLRKYDVASQTLGALEAFVLGALARSIATLTLFPYIRAKVLMQVNKTQIAATQLIRNQTDTCAESGKETIMSTLLRVYSEEGPLALYRGLGPEITRGALSSALMLMIKEKIQMYITLLIIVANSS
ncbi:mitochondrial carrier family [Plasmopara halstedii]|uniref:Mitochondrial carrier family n=1 Tax=Plasmopara halstedii TaxID=4781 RepID=A0A0P1AIS8_PLAHL|nr:mitochondrial carrier family [Plasmopara halstedii]CEG40965.1 mitochondrial carrier family [Plasmopara halstedii]|eukprot:XP_024577334.1 mitochondrial carrier family [Plasmopara halstedii]